MERQRYGVRRLVLSIAHIFWCGPAWPQSVEPDDAKVDRVVPNATAPKRRSRHFLCGKPRSVLADTTVLGEIRRGGSANSLNLPRQREWAAAPSRMRDHRLGTIERSEKARRRRPEGWRRRAPATRSTFAGSRSEIFPKLRRSRYRKRCGYCSGQVTALHRGRPCCTTHWVAAAEWPNQAKRRSWAFSVMARMAGFLRRRSAVMA